MNADCQLAFGNLQWNTKILERNYGSKHFFIESKKDPKIDAMFFPSTQGEQVSLNPSDQSYLEKSTIIMCNPNALIY